MAITRIEISAYSLGFKFGCGLTLGAIIVGSAVMLFTNVMTDLVTPYDSTDTAGVRSGLKPHTDALTGCQYLTSEKGWITPRLDSNGKHICGGQA